MLKEFRDFAMKGNVVDLAVGVIIGAAFGAIVSSLVGDIIMPIIGSISGWLMLLGMTARPRATSARTYSGVMWLLMPAASRPRFSRMAMNSISGVMTPLRA